MALRILHVFRSPLGGLFRHVRDLSHGQKLQGHHVGLFCDSSTGGSTAASALSMCREWCAGGITVRPIARLPSASDLGAIADVSQMAKSGGFDILHGHGAKGGLIARLAARRLGLPSVYTPHGGSLHYGWKSPAGAVFLTTEKLLGRIGSGFVFVCTYEQRLFEDKVGIAGKPFVVAHNGLWPEEFQPVSHGPDATDLLFVGEVRHLKGIDLLLQALRSLPGLSLTVVGDGPELDHHQSLAKALGLSQRVRFVGRKPMREALTMGRIMVVPSRNESFPYVILEAAAASVPIIATRVGGIPEALPPGMLCPPDTAAIATAIGQTVGQPEAAARRAKELSEKMRVEFSVAVMAETVTKFYANLHR